MSIDDQRRMLYMGGKNIFYIFSLNNALSDAASVKNYTWRATDDVIDSCTMKGTQFWECQNYIQVLLYNHVDSKLLVCGTNAQAPRCREFQVSEFVLLLNFGSMVRLRVWSLLNREVDFRALGNISLFRRFFIIKFVIP